MPAEPEEDLGGELPHHEHPSSELLGYTVTSIQVSRWTWGSYANIAKQTRAKICQESSID